MAIEDVYQLHNTSAVIRSCESFGIQELHMIEEVNRNRVDKEIAMGAQKWVDVRRYNTSSSCLKHLKSQGYRIVATSPHKNAHRLENFDITRKAAIFFGCEAQGVSETVLQEADDFIYIPMVGFTESLNISVSAAIIIQSLMIRLKESDVFWQLTAQKLLDKKLAWTRKMIKDIERIEARYYEDRGTS